MDSVEVEEQDRGIGDTLAGPGLRNWLKSFAEDVSLASGLKGVILPCCIGLFLQPDG